MADRAINDQAPQISVGLAGEAPRRRPRGRAQITPMERVLNGRLASCPARSRARPCVTARGSLCVT